MNAPTGLIDSLAASPVFQNYERAFNEALGLPLALVPADSVQPPLHGHARENSFCALLASADGTCATCQQTRQCLRREGAEHCTTTTCGFGLREAVVPVRLGQQTIGYLHTGQVLTRKPTASQAARVADRVAAGGVNASLEQIRRLYAQTPVLSEGRLQAVAETLTVLAAHLAAVGHQVTVRQEHNEPPLIARARDYIGAHLTEPLSLGAVAQAVHTSPFHLCKLFKRHTGINFTEFVSRSRVEHAKELLLEPHRRVSEVAFEVGFQSLTHFNRVFRRLLGESPTAFRARLPQSPSTDRQHVTLVHQ